MPIISGGKIIQGVRDRIVNAGAPAAGTDQVWTATVNGAPTGGTFRYLKDGIRSAALAHNADAATQQAALEAMPVFGTGGVTVSGTGPFVITAVGANGKQTQSALTTTDNQLTGGTTPSVSVANTTPGVAATARGAPKGAKLVDTTNGIDYINTGTAQAPTWTKVGTQT